MIRKSSGAIGLLILAGAAIHVQSQGVSRSPTPAGASAAKLQAENDSLRRVIATLRAGSTRHDGLQNGLRIIDTLATFMHHSLFVCADSGIIINMQAQTAAMGTRSKPDIESLTQAQVACEDRALAGGDSLFRRITGADVPPKVLDETKDVYAFWKSAIRELLPSGEEFVSPGLRAFQSRLDGLNAEMSKRITRLRLDLT